MRAYEELWHGAYITPDAQRKSQLEYPELFNTPIVRNGKEATVGYCSGRLGQMGVKSSRRGTLLWTTPAENRFLRFCVLMAHRCGRYNVAMQSAALAFYLLFMIFPSSFSSAPCWVCWI